MLDKLSYLRIVPQCGIRLCWPTFAEHVLKLLEQQSKSSRNWFLANESDCDKICMVYLYLKNMFSCSFEINQ